MIKKEQKTVICPICKEQKKMNEVLPGEMVREPVVEKIKMKYPDWSNSDLICISDLNRFRAEYVQQVIETDKGNNSSLIFTLSKILRQVKLYDRISIDDKPYNCILGSSNIQRRNL
jgi:hypothetical protein